MTERIAFGAMALLLAAGVMSQTRSPAFAALAGSYVAVSTTGEQSRQIILTLAADGTASLRTAALDGSNESAPESGSWLLDGNTVQIALAGDAIEGPHGLSLRTTGTALVANGADSPDASSRFAGLIFTRASAATPPSGAQ